MLFTVKVASVASLQQHETKELLFVRYYCTLSEEAPERDLSLRHLEWESVVTGAGRSKMHSPHYAIIDCNSVLQRVCICPHFSFWDEGKCNHFLVNDMLGLWPREELLPQQPYQHTGKDPVA